jgi:PAS domain S-box-containing protein
VILNDASVQNLFSTDEYLRARHSRSILCVPLLKQGELIGVLYLENNLTDRVFTPDRLAILELLASQAAISLENARLYADLTRENMDRRNAGEALRASEERWRKLFESSSAGIALIAPNSRYIAANAALQKMLGYTEAELQRLTALEVTHEEDRAATEAILAESADGQRRDYRIEKRYRRKDGSVRWADISTVFVPASGKTSAFYATVIVDITDRKRAEEEIKRIRRLEGEVRQGTDSKIDKAVDDALVRAQFQVVPLDQAFKEKWDQAEKDGNTLAAAGVWISDRKYFDKLVGVSARTKAIIAWGGFNFATNYQNALRRQAAWQQALHETFKKVDFIALPTLQKLPPRIPIGALFEAQMLGLQNTVPVNFAGNPALAIPIPLNDKIFPDTSLQLVGSPLSEADLLNVGRLVEARSQLDRWVMSMKFARNQ